MQGHVGLLHELFERPAGMLAQHPLGSPRGPRRLLTTTQPINHGNQQLRLPIVTHHIDITGYVLALLRPTGSSPGGHRRAPPGPGRVRLVNHLIARTVVPTPTVDAI